MLIERLPLIRHARYYWLSFQFWRWWGALGRHLGAVPNEQDLKYLRDVWNGKA
jgi:hypothetical protein